MLLAAIKKGVLSREEIAEAVKLQPATLDQGCFVGRMEERTLRAVRMVGRWSKGKDDKSSNFETVFPRGPSGSLFNETF